MPLRIQRPQHAQQSRQTCRRRSFTRRIIATSLTECSDKPGVAALLTGYISPAVALAFFEVEDRCHARRVAHPPLGRARPGCRRLLANRPAFVPNLNRKPRVLAEPVLDRLLRGGSHVPSTRRLDLPHNLAWRLPRAARQQNNQ